MGSRGDASSDWSERETRDSRDPDLGNVVSKVLYPLTAISDVVFQLLTDGVIIVS